MRTSIGRLRAMIREELDLGRVVFSPERRDGVPTDEPNTPDEQEIYDGLGAWVWDKRRGADRDMVADIKTLMGDPRYSDFFSPPSPGTVLYRGLHSVPWDVITSKWLVGPENKVAYDALDNKPRGEVECDFVMRLSVGWDAWTTDLDVAKRFARSGNLGPALGDLNVVLVARAGDSPRSFFDLSAIQRAVPSLMFSSGIDEGETLAIGPVAVTGIVWGV